MSEHDNQYNYIRRGGRLTSGQARSLETLRSTYAIAQLERSPQRPLGVEIGFGMGHALLQWAQERPTWDLVGIELYQPGIGALLNGLARAELKHVRYIEQPAQRVLAAACSHCIDEVRIYFPDPWPKKRHAKRRLIQPEFVTELARVVAIGGRVHLATDWAPYADWILTCFDECPAFREITDDLDLAALRARTKFEMRGERLGHAIVDRVYECLHELGDDSV